MRKLITLLLFVISFTIGYSQSQKDNQNNEDNIENYGVGNVPKFSDSEVQNFVNQYDAFVVEYLQAINQQDNKRIEELIPKFQKWMTTSEKITQKLTNNPTDREKFELYGKNVIKQLSQLSDVDQ